MKFNLFLAILLLASGLAFAQDNQVQFNGGWIKQLPPVVPMRAGYIKIVNTSEKPRKIVAMQSSSFEKVEMHETKLVDGLMKMIALDSIDLPANSTTEFKPGGKHMMLITPLQTLAIGDKVEIIATFEDETSQSFMLEIKK